MSRLRRVAAMVVVMVAIVAGAGACSDQPAVCDDVDSLRASLDELGRAAGQEDRVTAVPDALDAVRSDLVRLGNDASAEFAPQVETVKSSVDDLESTIEQATAERDAAGFAAVAVSARAAGAAVGALADAVSSTC